MKTIFALFQEYEQAEANISRLLEEEFPAEEMNVIVLETVAKNVMDVRWNEVKVEKTDEIGGKKVHGLDAMLGGQQAVGVPDVGKVLAAGKLGTTLVNTASFPEAADGGLQKALMDFDIPEAAAEEYRDGIKAGSFLFFMRTEDERAPAATARLREGAKQVANY